MRLFIAVLLLAGAQLAQAADPVGRIFYTPEERARLDGLRAKRAVATQVPNEPVPEYVTYNGIVRRSDGLATVWVNGELLSETDLRTKQAIIGRVSRNGQILLQTPEAAATSQIRLKVGQSAELLSGQVDEPFSVKRAGNDPKPAPETGASPPAAAVGTAPARTAPEASRNKEEIAPAVVREIVPAPDGISTATKK